MRVNIFVNILTNSSKKFLTPLTLFLLASLPLAAMGHPELSYQINGVKYLPVEGKLMNEYTGEDYLEENPGVRPRFYQGGSGTSRAVLRAAEYIYRAEVEESADFLFESLGSTAAVRGLLTSQLDWAVLGRPLLDSEKDEGLVEVPMAYDSVFLAVQKDGISGVESLTKAQVAAIFVGEISNWKDVGGPDLPIRPIGFSELSGNFGMFKDLVLEPVYGDDARYSLGMESLLIDLDVANKLRELPGSLAFGAYSAQIPLELEKMKLLKVEGEELNSENVLTFRYPLVRILNFVTKGDAQGPAKEFLDILLGQEVQKSLKILKLESAE